MNIAATVTLVGTLVLLGVGAATDMRRRRIPNTLTMGGAVLGVLVNGIFFGLHGVQQSFLGWGLGFVILIIPFLQDAIGAGDVKMLAAVGAWGGTALVFRTAVLGALVGAVIAIGYLIVYGDIAILLRQLGRYIRLRLFLTASLVWPGALALAVEMGDLTITRGDRRPRRTIPYGVAVALGGLAALLAGGF